jgi:hypothetical protein
MMPGRSDDLAPNFEEPIIYLGPWTVVQKYQMGSSKLTVKTKSFATKRVSIFFPEHYDVWLILPFPHNYGVAVEGNYGLLHAESAGVFRPRRHIRPCEYRS